MLTLRERASIHIPRCLSEITVSLENFNLERDAVRFSLSRRNEEFARVLGYSLQNYNPAYKGDLLFISPIILEWRENKHQTLVFDSKLHGYHGEMNASAKLRGSGKPTGFKCFQCAGEFFKLQAQFDYCDAAYDLWEDEPEIDAENYFCFFTLIGSCVACKHEAVIVAMDL